jgi:hypothetical protein
MSVNLNQQEDFQESTLYGTCQHLDTPSSTSPEALLWHTGQSAEDLKRMRNRLAQRKHRRRECLLASPLFPFVSLSSFLCPSGKQLFYGTYAHLTYSGLGKKALQEVGKLDVLWERPSTTLAMSAYEVLPQTQSVQCGGQNESPDVDNQRYGLASAIFGKPFTLV